MRILMPVPDHDFDITEVAVPWRLLTDAGHSVVFATEAGGTAPQGDPLLLTGVIFGQLGADPEPKAFYRELLASAEFAAPIAWGQIDAGAFDGLILPGGHAPGMRQYLGSPELQATVADFWALQRPVGAICHGVIVLARTIDPGTGRSVLAGRTTACLPKFMERTAYWLTAWKLGRYYRTYPAYVEDEVRSVLDDPARQFRRGPRSTARGSRTDHRHAFVVEDGNLITARWPGDAYLFAERFMAALDTHASTPSAARNSPQT